MISGHFNHGNEADSTYARISLSMGKGEPSVNTWMLLIQTRLSVLLWAGWRSWVTMVTGFLVLWTVLTCEEEVLSSASSHDLREFRLKSGLFGRHHFSSQERELIIMGPPHAPVIRLYCKGP